MSTGARPGGLRGSAPTSRSASQGGGPGGGQAGGETHSLRGSEQDEEQVRRYAKTILCEFAQNGSREALVVDFCERAHINNLHSFLGAFIELAIESKVDPAQTAVAIRELHEKRIVSSKHVEQVVKDQLSMAEDLVIDIPKYYERMAGVLAPLLVAEGKTFKDLLRAIASSLEVSNAAKMLVPLFKRIREISSGE